MLLTKIHTAPDLDSFTALEDHQSKTPDTFYEAKPVLYFHDNNARALIVKSQLVKLPICEINSSENEPESSPKIAKVDVFVNSQKLIIFNPVERIGYAIPYSAITLHAIQRLKDPVDSYLEIQGLYMQINISDCSGNEQQDEDSTYVDLTLIPSPSSDTVTKPSIQTLYEAVSACSDLNPDLTSENGGITEDVGEESRIIFEGTDGLPGVFNGVSDGNLPPPFPGSGGWITAENVSQFFDEEGNWIGESGNDEDSMVIG
ncbi:hypothetical protein Golomagni_03254 [Golovinomyces magnicellulatus]|nr:hypothetical protein Golomagni_03254 [Golovinomyces magnicellulatus]